MHGVSSAGCRNSFLTGFSAFLSGCGISSSACVVHQAVEGVDGGRFAPFGAEEVLTLYLGRGKYGVLLRRVGR